MAVSGPHAGSGPREQSATARKVQRERRSEVPYPDGHVGRERGSQSGGTACFVLVQCILLLHKNVYIRPLHITHLPTASGRGRPTQPCPTRRGSKGTHG